MNKTKIVISVCVLFFLFSIPVLAAGDFADVPKSHWAHTAVQALSQKGIITGYPDGTFRPGAKVTREQFAIILVKALAIPLREKDRVIRTFWDIDENHRAYLYIDAAKPYIPVPNPKGYALNFYPDRPITREEVAQTMVAALKINQFQKPGSNYLATKYKDYQSISPDFKEGVALASYYGILSGNAAGNLSPKAPVSRGELSIIVNNVLQNNSSFKEGFPPPHKPMTIEFIDFKRPDWEKVRDFPDYNKPQSFYGKITAKIFGINNSHLVVTYSETVKSTGERTTWLGTITKTTHVYLTDKDMDLFNLNDWYTFNYDRNNNILSYTKH